MKALQAMVAVAIAAASLAAHAVGQRADVSIYDRATGRTLPVYWHEGRAYVVGRPGNEYQVILKNRVGEDLLAIVSVDGLNVMDGQPANPRQGGAYIVTRGSQVDIKGWRKSMEEVAAFYFTSLTDSYAGRTGRPDNVGVIGVSLFERKRQYFPPGVAETDESYRRRRDEARAKSQADGQANRDSAPKEERTQQPKLVERSSSDSNAPPAAAAPLGTGHGRREESRVQFQRFERSTDAPVETIAIYYDSYRNLVAQGVLQPAYGRRDPNPWPTSFTPDP